MKQANQLDVLTAKIAILASRGLKQKEVARKLGISQATVSRYLTDAERLGLLVNQPPLLKPDRVDKNTLKTAEDQVNELLSLAPLTEKLRAAFPHLHHVTVVEAPSKETTEAAWQKRIEVIAQAAAKVLAKRFSSRKVTTVGITWGRTQQAVVNALIRRDPDLKHITFVPLSGEPIFTEEPRHELSASTLAHQLAMAANAADVPLSPLPVAIPQQFSKPADVKLLRRFFEQIPSYQKAKKYFPKLDAITCSCGPSAWRHEQASEAFAGLKQGEWRRKVMGDFGGYCCANPGYEDIVDEINERSLGARIEDFEACCAKSSAAKGNPPGVILTGHGPLLAPILEHLLKRENQCINEIIIDDDLANALIRRTRQNRSP